MSSKASSKHIFINGEDILESHLCSAVALPSSFDGSVNLWVVRDILQNPAIVFNPYDDLQFCGRQDQRMCNSPIAGIWAMSLASSID